jgi:hypothetical protein
MVEAHPPLEAATILILAQVVERREELAVPIVVGEVQLHEIKARLLDPSCSPDVVERLIDGLTDLVLALDFEASAGTFPDGLTYQPRLHTVTH